MRHLCNRYLFFNHKSCITNQFIRSHKLKSTCIMGERCEIFLEKAIYYPGDTVNGRVDCHFLQENKVTAIIVRFKGKAKVHWKEGKNSNYNAEVVYFEQEANLLTQETVFPTGVYGYPFTFTLLADIPSSMNGTYGSITYSVKCKIDRPWAIDYESKKIFEVHSYYNLNSMNEIKMPYEFEQNLIPKLLYMIEASGPISITVRLPVTGFVPSQMIPFFAKIINNSGVTVEEVHFCLVQGFIFYANDRSKEVCEFVGQEYAITDSRVVSGSQKSWELELRVPSDMYNRSLQLCRIIKGFWEIKGEIFLPAAYKNLKIRIPFVLGNEPISGTFL